MTLEAEVGDLQSDYERCRQSGTGSRWLRGSVVFMVEALSGIDLFSRAMHGVFEWGRRCQSYILLREIHSSIEPIYKIGTSAPLVPLWWPNLGNIPALSSRKGRRSRRAASIKENRFPSSRDFNGAVPIRARWHLKEGRCQSGYIGTKLELE